MTRSRKIRTRPDSNLGDPERRVTIGGWLQGPATYLHLSVEGRNELSVVSGHRLYRLAKAIVKQFEREGTGDDD